jgi:hypothetical protein
MFNMEWLLPGHSCDKCNGGPNHLYFLAFWLDSIAAHAVDANEDPEIAPIILVGTHKDRVPSAADHVMISKKLDEIFSGKPAWSSVERFKKAKVISGRGALWFFPVDNTIGNKDPVMVHIQEVVLERVKKERYVNEKVPFAWLKVLEQLQNVDKGSSITLQQVLTICKECGLPRTAEESLEGEAMKMLKRFNDLGQLMYHPDDIKLRDVVILDPVKFLVTPAALVICDHEIHENEHLLKARNKLGRLYHRLCKKGILHAQLLDILWEDRRDHIEILQTLLVKLGFFVPILQDIKSTTTDTETSYLIPHLLPKRLSVQAPNPKLVGYIFFALKHTMQDIRTKGYVSLDEITRDGFFPMGLAPAVMGQIVSECQRVHNTTIDDMQLSIDEIETSFGHHKFSARSNRELQVIQLLIMVDSSLLTVERILDLVGKAVAQMVPNLDFVFAVDQDGGRCSNGEVPKPRGPLVLISGQDGLQDKLRKDASEISVSPGETWSPLQAQQHFAAWLEPKGLRKQGYDVFISYRWTLFDTELVMALFSKFCHTLVGKRQVHVFVDRWRLEAGRMFDRDFSVALMKSTIAVAIVSLASMERMKILTADSDIDNVLLEWTLICELLAIGDLEYCLPVMIGNVTEHTQADGRFITNLFATGIIKDLPAVVCARVVKFVTQVLEDNGKKPSKDLSTRTVRGTVETITKALGVLTWDIASSHGGGGGRSSAHSRDEWKRCVYTEIVKQSMKCVEAAEAEGKSKVTPDSSPACEGVEVVAAPPAGVGQCEEETSAVPASDPAVPSIDEWLESIALAEYASQIKDYGCDSLQALEDASEQDIKDMTEDADIGMKKLHRSLFMESPSCFQRGWGWQSRSEDDGRGR